MSHLARNRRLMYVFAALRGLGSYSATVFGIIFVFQARGIWGVVAYNLSWTVGIVLSAILSLPLARRLPVRVIAMIGLLFLAAGYGLLAPGWGFAAMGLLSLIGLLQGTGSGLSIWAQGLLFKSANEDASVGKHTAYFLAVFSLMSALTPALLGLLAVGSGLGWSIALVGICLGLAAVPLAFYHEGHLEEFLPPGDSLRKEWRRVRGEYRFRSDAMRSSFLDGLTSENYITCLMLLLFLANASSPAVLGYVMTGAALFSVVIQMVRGAHFDAKQGKDEVPKTPTLIAQVLTLAQPFLVGFPWGFGLAETAVVILWTPADLVTQAHYTRNMRALGGGSYLAIVQGLSRLPVLVFYALFTILLLAGVPLQTLLIVMSMLATASCFPYALVLNRQSAHSPATAGLEPAAELALDAGSEAAAD